MLGYWQQDIRGMPNSGGHSLLEIQAGYTLGKRVPTQAELPNIIPGARLHNVEATLNYANISPLTRSTQIPGPMPTIGLTRRISSHLGLISLPKIIPGIV